MHLPSKQSLSRSQTAKNYHYVMKKVDNMEDLVQLDLNAVNELVGVEAGRQLHTFINHSLLAPTSRNSDKQGADSAAQTGVDIETSAQNGSSAVRSRENTENPEPIELDIEISD